MASTGSISTTPARVKVSQEKCLFIIDSKYYPLHAITFHKARRIAAAKWPPLAIPAFDRCEALTPYYINSPSWYGYFIYDHLGNLFWSPTEKLDPIGWSLIKKSKPMQSREVHLANFADSTIARATSPLEIVPLAELVFSYRVDEHVPAPPTPEIISEEDETLTDSEIEAIIAQLPQPDPEEN